MAKSDTQKADAVAKYLFQCLEAANRLDVKFDSAFCGETGLPEAGGGDWELAPEDRHLRFNIEEKNKSAFTMTFTDFTTFAVTVENLGDLRP